ncbi:cyclin-L1-like [Watersipora subatra]|uniref:cyclin-L1-like n=1 Tax=Watersipora subatra TaxID=2589382 RepID=UPI00355B74BC
MAATKIDWEYSGVLLTLDNALLSEEKLSPTPSMQDGLDSEIEQDLRILGCELIQTAGILLKLPQVAMATGQVLFQRFYYCKSFVNHNMDIVAMAAVNLAAKIEEAPRRIRDVINVFHHMKQIRQKRLLTPLILDEHYVKLKNDVIKAERRLLKELGFCVHVQHPHKLIMMYLKVLNQDNNKQLVQKAWNNMNDSFRSNVFVRFHPETIAAACIYLAARQVKVPLPNRKPSWFSVISHTTLPAIRQICMEILRLYTRAKPDSDELEKAVAVLKKAQVEAKARLRGGLGNNTPNQNSTSRPATPSKISPHSGTEDQKQKGDMLINGLKRKLKERNNRSRSVSRSPHRKHSRQLPKGYRDHRSRSKERRHHDHKSKSKSRRRSRSRSYDRSSKKARSRSRSKTRHRTSSKRSRSRDRYRR